MSTESSVVTDACGVVLIIAATIFLALVCLGAAIGAIAFIARGIKAIREGHL